MSAVNGQAYPVITTRVLVLGYTFFDINLYVSAPDPKAGIGLVLTIVSYKRLKAPSD